MKRESGTGRARDRLQDLLDGALSPEEARRVEAELAGSEESASELEEWRGLFRALDTLGEVAPSIDLVDRVMAEVEAEAGARAIEAPPGRIRTRLATLGRWIGLGGDRIPDSGTVSPALVEQYLEGTLEDAEAARVERALATSERLRAHGRAMAGLFDHLDELEPIEVPTGFRDRVVAAAEAIGHQRAPVPAHLAGVARLGERMAARSRVWAERLRRWSASGRGWAAACGVAVAPVAILVTIGISVLSQPGFSFSDLLVWLRWRAGDLGTALADGVSGRIGQFGPEWLDSSIVSASWTSTGTLLALGVAFLITMVLSALVLVRNLNEPAAREAR